MPNGLQEEKSNKEWKNSDIEYDDGIIAPIAMDKDVLPWYIHKNLTFDHQKT